MTKIGKLSVLDTSARAHSPEGLEVIHGQVVAEQVQQNVLQSTAVTVAQYEAAERERC